MRKALAVCLATLLGSFPLVLNLSAKNLLPDRSRAAVPIVKLDWSLLKVGDMVAAGKLGPKGCVFPRIQTTTEHVPGKQRFLRIATDVQCRLVVVERGEREALHSSNKADGSTRIRFYDPSQTKPRSSSERGIMADGMAHGHVFPAISGQNYYAIEVHAAYYYYFDGDQVAVDTAPGGPYFTYDVNPEWWGYEANGEADCGPVAESLGALVCWHTGYASAEPFGYAEAAVWTYANLADQTWCVDASVYEGWFYDWTNYC